MKDQEQRASTSRRLNAPRARAALAWAMATFVLVQVVLLSIIHYRLPELPDPEYGSKLMCLRARIAEEPGRPLTVVMLGSSRTIFALKGDCLDEPVATAARRRAIVFNFGTTAAGPVKNLVNLQRLLADGVRPDLLLIEVLPPLLCDQSVESHAMPIDRLQWRDLRVLEQYDFPDPHPRFSWLRVNLAPCYSRRFSLVRKADPAYLAPRLEQGFSWEIDRSGWIAFSADGIEPRNRPKWLANARKEYTPCLNDFRLGERPCRALRQLLETCRRENIPAALVLMPEGPEFRSWYHDSDWARIEDFLEALRREFAVPLINAREWLEEDAFVDSHHLKPAGAELFTDRLGHEALLPLVWEKVLRPGTVSSR